MPPGPSVASAVRGLVVARSLSSTGPGLGLAQFGIMVLVGGNQVEMDVRVSRSVPCAAVATLLVLPLLSCPRHSLAGCRLAIRVLLALGFVVTATVPSEAGSPGTLVLGTRRLGPSVVGLLADMWWQPPCLSMVLAPELVRA